MELYFVAFDGMKTLRNFASVSPEAQFLRVPEITFPSDEILRLDNEPKAFTVPVVDDRTQRLF